MEDIKQRKMKQNRLSKNDKNYFIWLDEVHLFEIDEYEKMRQRVFGPRKPVVIDIMGV